MDGVFLGLAGLLLKISLGLRPQEIPWSSPARPRKTPSIPPLLLGFTQYLNAIAFFLLNNGFFSQPLVHYFIAQY